MNITWEQIAETQNITVELCEKYIDMIDFDNIDGSLPWEFVEKHLEEFDFDELVLNYIIPNDIIEKNIMCITDWGSFARHQQLSTDKVNEYKNLKHTLSHSCRF